VFSIASSVASANENKARRATVARIIDFILAGDSGTVVVLISVDEKPDETATLLYSPLESQRDWIYYHM
jgi:uncharacterized protein YdaL